MLVNRLHNPRYHNRQFGHQFNKQSNYCKKISLIGPRLNFCVFRGDKLNFIKNNICFILVMAMVSKLSVEWSAVLPVT